MTFLITLKITFTEWGGLRERGGRARLFLLSLNMMWNSTRKLNILWGKNWKLSKVRKMKFYCFRKGYKKLKESPIRKLNPWLLTMTTNRHKMISKILRKIRYWEEKKSENKWKINTKQKKTTEGKKLLIFEYIRIHSFYIKILYLTNIYYVCI